MKVNALELSKTTRTNQKQPVPNKNHPYPSKNNPYQSKHDLYQSKNNPYQNRTKTVPTHTRTTVKTVVRAKITRTNTRSNPYQLWSAHDFVIFLVCPFQKKSDQSSLNDFYSVMLDLNTKCQEIAWISDQNCAICFLTILYHQRTLDLTRYAHECCLKQSMRCFPCQLM